MRRHGEDAVAFLGTDQAHFVSSARTGVMNRHIGRTGDDQRERKTSSALFDIEQWQLVPSQAHHSCERAGALSEDERPGNRSGLAGVRLFARPLSFESAFGRGARRAKRADRRQRNDNP
jgi:hypothetical protein